MEAESQGRSYTQSPSLAEETEQPWNTLARAPAAMERTQRGGDSGQCHPGKGQTLQAGRVAPPPPLCEGVMGAWAMMGSCIAKKLLLELVLLTRYLGNH